MVGITYGIQPYGGHTMGWTSPFVIGCLGGGVALLIAFGMIETRVADPMFRLPLFRIRAFTAGCLSTLLAGIGRGGLMFMLIIWLQGIWLPLHGYDFARTPLWAGIYMLPLTAGFLIAGPMSGYLSDRFGSRPFATGGMLARRRLLRPARAAPGRLLLLAFAALLLVQRAGHGGVRRSEPGRRHEQPARQHRGVGGGMNSTFQNSAQVLSIGVFFTLMIVGLSSTLPSRSLSRPHSPRRARRPAHAGPPACRRSPRSSPPSWATARCSTCSATGALPTCRRPTAVAQRARFLPPPHLQPFHQGCTPPSTSPSSPA